MLVEYKWTFIVQLLDLVATENAIETCNKIVVRTRSQHTSWQDVMQWNKYRIKLHCWKLHCLCKQTSEFRKHFKMYIFICPCAIEFRIECDHITKFLFRCYGTRVVCFHEQFEKF